MVTLDHVDWTRVSYQELDLMIRVCEQVNTEMRNNLTPLCMACKCNREDLVSILLHHGAQTNKASSFQNKQPLHYACAHSHGNLGIVRKLLQADANVDAFDWDGNTALHLACTETNVAVVELLIESGANVNLSDVDGETPLVRACYAKSQELIEMLLKRGSDPDALGGHPVEIAVLNSSAPALRLLVEAGADVNLGTYLSLACYHNHIEMMKILNRYGVDVNKSDVRSTTPLHTACLSLQANEECVRLLLQWGANVNAATGFGETALCCAINTHSVGKIKLLLAFGADVNSCNPHFISSMMACCQNSPALEVCVQIFGLLLAAGMKLSRDKLESLEIGVSIFQNCEAKTDLINLIRTHVTQPLSLQSWCRIGIRSSMKPNIDVNMRSLALPFHLERFLNFCDITKEPE